MFDSGTKVIHWANDAEGIVYSYGVGGKGGGNIDAYLILYPEINLNGL